MQWQNEQLANPSSSSSLPYWFQILVLKVNLNNPSSLHIAGDSFFTVFFVHKVLNTVVPYFLNNKQNQAHQKTLLFLFTSCKQENNSL